MIGQKFSDKVRLINSVHTGTTSTRSIPYYFTYSIIGQILVAWINKEMALPESWRNSFSKWINNLNDYKHHMKLDFYKKVNIWLWRHVRIFIAAPWLWTTQVVDKEETTELQKELPLDKNKKFCGSFAQQGNHRGLFFICFKDMEEGILNICINR